MSKTVCVTGASGFLATQIVKQLLEKGYQVHGTVRDPSDKKKVDHLVSLPGASERLKIFKADLLGGPEAYQEAVKGSEIVFHTASPFYHGGQEDDYVKPAVDGTLTVLKAVTTHPEVKTVILTSSFAAVGYAGLDRSHVYTEADWSSEDWQREQKSFYGVSKTKAEKAAWDFSKGKDYRLVVINPCLITGPIIQPTLNTSSEMVAQYLNGSKTKIANGGISYIDVRDVAEAHIAAAENKDAQGRYLVLADSLSWEDLANFLRKEYGDKYEVPTELEADAKPWDKNKFDCSKVQKLLGHPLISAHDSIRETVAGLEKIGHIKPNKNN